MLSQSPPRRISATLIEVGLHIAGHEMGKQFGPQFDKLLRYISKVFLPACKVVAEESSTPGLVTTRMITV